MNRASIMALLDTVLLRSWRIGVDPIVASTALTADQLGHVVVDATAGDLTVTLPSSSASLRGVEVTLRRKDVTANVLSIVAAGAEKIVLPGAADGIAATELIFPGDYLTLRSDGAGKWWVVGQAQLPGSLNRGLQVITIIGVSTYAVPAVLRSGRIRARVTVIGGGGSGGVKRISGEAGGGGGGGGGIAQSVIDLTGLETISVTVGAGATGATNPGPGNSGLSSSFGALLSATGGTFGGGSASSSVASGGNSGSGVGGQYNSRIGYGGYGSLVTSTSGVGGTGGGGSSPGATGASPAASYGHGSGGVGSGASSYTLDGGHGVVIIEW
ncbi:glycine-rich domain-containing protein [Pseudomonas guariconensis]|uniref:glycine-rich domain-containing protein n=1 Tax=Pseudomonas guariconensis TaxID=1288410 RepID=UPI0018AC7B33|nr:hypothetical protein [Pseudomonas guariconensis]MBF8754617.1 hypothetical protein [Pseudomonas guariconensis]